MLSSILSEIMGWVAFLQRPPVLLQLLLVAAWYGLIGQLHLHRPARPRLLRWLWRRPWALTMSLGTGLITLVLTALQQRAGLSCCCSRSTWPGS